MKQHRRATAAHQIGVCKRSPHVSPLNPLPGPSDTTANVDEMRFHAKQQQLYCFSKDATHNEWTTSHLSIIHTLSYYWSVSLAVNVVFPNDW